MAETLWSIPRQPAPRQPRTRDGKLWDEYQSIVSARNEGMASLYDEEVAFDRWAEAVELRFLREDCEGGR